MDGLANAVGNGISSVVSTAFDGIGSSLRGIVATANTTLPGGLLPIVAFVVLLGTAWVLARR
jgi:hypothetical protein